MELSIINEIREQVKQFNSLEEFDLFYQKHKDEMNARTTQYLNKVYKIKCADGSEYRITKKNCVKQDNKISGGDIYLKKVVSKKIDDNNSITDLMYANIQADITNLRAELDNVRNELNHVLDSIKSLTDTANEVCNIKSTLNEVIKVVNELTR